MCGIFGFIGASKDPKVSFDLLHKLFLKTEVRGTDASGFFALEPGDGSVMYDKEDTKSSEYVKKSVWATDAKEQIESGVDLFIGHCRQTSVGGGPEKINKNNHPHVSDDRRIGVVHNGKIPEFSALKGKYDVGSDCDSEILLRMFESAQMLAKDREAELQKEFPKLTPFLAERILGLKEIFSRVNYGAMAVAIAERGDDASRYLWLFRDEDRPLHVIDMRKTLGQIFFCSTAEIWRQVVEDTPSAKQYISQDQVIIEFPAHQIWLLSLSDLEEGANKPWHIRKFKISKTKYIDWQKEDEEDEKLTFKRPTDVAKSKPPMVVKCRLGKDETLPAVLKEEPSEPPPLPVKVEGGKKKADRRVNDTDGRNTGTALASGVNAKVQVREPGDEEAWIPLEAELESLDTVVLTAAEINQTETGGIDLDAFDKKYDVIIRELKALKDAVHKQAGENALAPKEFSVVLDQLECVRMEVTSANNTVSQT